MLTVILEKMTKDIIAAGFLRIAPAVPIDPVKHEFTQPVHRCFHWFAHGKMRLVLTEGNNIRNHRVNPFTMAVSQDVQAVFRELKGFQNAGAQRVVQIVVQIGDPVCPPDTFRFHGGRFGFAGMGEDSLADFFCQIQPFTTVFKHLEHPKTLFIVTETFRQQVVQRSFSDMAVRRMPQIVSERNGFRKVFVQTERAGQRTGNL